MGALVFRCPRTANYIDAQVDTDERSIRSSRDEAMRVYCPHCKDEHVLPLSAAIVEEGESPRGNG
jgi:hypothetical protein